MNLITWQSAQDGIVKGTDHNGSIWTITPHSVDAGCYNVELDGKWFGRGYGRHVGDVKMAIVKILGGNR